MEERGREESDAQYVQQCIALVGDRRKGLVESAERRTSGRGNVAWHGRDQTANCAGRSEGLRWSESYRVRIDSGVDQRHGFVTDDPNSVGARP